nr:hypothetical protein GCM10020093_048340 [Planobispora longispora]
MSELAHRVVSLDDVLGPWAGAAVERLAAVPDWHDRLALLDALLTRRIHAAPESDPRVGWAWRRLRASRARFRSRSSPVSWGGAIATWSPASTTRSGCPPRPSRG